MRSKAGEVIEGMSNEDYHSHPSYSSSQIKYASRNIEHFKRAVIDKVSPKQSSTAFRIGTLFHEMILEPEIFRPNIYPGYKIDKRTKAYKDWLRENPEATEDNTLTGAEMDKLLLMKENLLKHTDCPDFAATTNELSMFYEYYGMNLRTRPDAICFKTRTVLDLKTTSKPIDKYGFLSQVKYFDYDLSAAMYLHNMLAHHGEKFKFTWVVVQTVEPYSAAIYHVGKGLLESGWEKFENGLYSIQQSFENDSFVFQERAETLDV